MRISHDKFNCLKFHAKLICMLIVTDILFQEHDIQHQHGDTGEKRCKYLFFLTVNRLHDTCFLFVWFWSEPAISTPAKTVYMWVDSSDVLLHLLSTIVTIFYSVCVGV